MLGTPGSGGAGRSSFSVTASTASPNASCDAFPGLAPLEALELLLECCYLCFKCPPLWPGSSAGLGDDT